MKKFLISLGIAALAMSGFSCLANPEPKESKTDKNNLRLLYWNIQNGMWAGQPDNYDQFVEFVKQQNPDVCVWCEAATIYKDNSADGQKKELCYLPDNWGELAARYGHKYWYKGGHRDNYPQVITSKYPIKGMAQITGEKPDSVVSHGSGWAQIEKNGNTINIVTLHTWPHAYKHGLPRDQAIRQASAAENGGDKYRRMELEYICNHTIGQVPNADQQMWMMMGDFNSISSVDNYQYKRPLDSPAFYVHDYIRNNTPYLDVIAEKYPGEFKTSCGGMARIDYIYCTKPLYDRVKTAGFISNEYTKPVREPNNLSNFYLPSDHLPLVVDFDMKKAKKNKK